MMMRWHGMAWHAAMILCTAHAVDNRLPAGRKPTVEAGHPKGKEWKEGKEGEVGKEGKG
jgi:hypothetical protein